jgi:hypothetical protein
MPMGLFVKPVTQAIVAKEITEAGSQRQGMPVAVPIGARRSLL